MNWVLLRGLMREARHWGGFPAQLQQAFPAATIITPDLPGNGRLWFEASPTRIEDMVEHCRATLRGLGHAPPYHLLALSLGGMVAKCWSERHPEEVPAMVLISTSMRPYNPFHQRLRPATYPALIRMALASDPARREETILRLTSTLTGARGAARRPMYTPRGAAMRVNARCRGLMRCGSCWRLRGFVRMERRLRRGCCCSRAAGIAW